MCGAQTHLHTLIYWSALDQIVSLEDESSNRLVDRQKNNLQNVLIIDMKVIFES